MAIKYPLVLVADDGPHLFGSAEELIRDIEPMDVQLKLSELIQRMQRG